MTKQEQINKIAEELLAYQPLIDIPFEQFYKVARAIVDLGYRKVDKNSIILTKEELVKTMESGYVYDTTRGNKVNIIEMAREIERKETAKEILQRAVNICKDEENFKDGTVNTQLEPLYFGLANGFAYVKDRIKNLAEEYGVEVEE